MKLLPNLSSLGVNNKSKRREEAVGAPFVPSTTPVNIAQVDWVQLFKVIQNSTENVEIAFIIATVPVPTTNKNLTLRFVVERYINGIRFLVKSVDKVTNHCVEVVLIPNTNDPAGVTLESLFYGLSDALLATCEMQPKHSETRGAGSIAIEMIQAISVQMRQWTRLTDAAIPLSRSDGLEIPLWMRGRKLTETHSIARGAGYYQRRGFMPDALVNAVVFAYKEASKVQPLAYYAGFYILQSVLLQWTELVFNTPINQIVDAIRTRFTPILQQIQASQSTSAFPNLPPASQHPIFRMFSPENLDEHANYLQNGFGGSSTSPSPIDLFTQSIEGIADATNNCPERFGVVSYLDFSIRRLMHMATYEKSIFQSRNDGMAEDFKNEAFNFADNAWEYVNGKEVFGTKLVCPFVEYNGSIGYIGVVESTIPGGVPAADFIVVDNNFAVQFEPALSALFALPTRQPPHSFLNNDPDAGGVQELE